MKFKDIGFGPYGFYSFVLWLAGGILFFSSVFWVVMKGSRDVKTASASTALLESLAVSSLALTSECDSARSPLEGICNSAGDIPGGYPYHSSCDVVNPPKILKQQSFTIKVLSSKS